MVEIFVGIYVLIVGFSTISALILEDVWRDEEYWKKHSWNESIEKEICLKFLKNLDFNIIILSITTLNLKEISMEKRYVIRGLAPDKNSKFCDRVVSTKAWKSRSSALKALKRNDFDTCFNPYVSSVTIVKKS